MQFTERETRLLLYCVAEEYRARSLGKPPGPQPWLAELQRRLEAELVSLSRQSDAQSESSSEDETWLGSTETARLLGWNIRRVQRHAANFDGRIIAGRWVFRETAVREYREGMTDDRNIA